MTRSFALSVLVCGFLLAALLSIEIGAPWQYAHDDNGAWTQAVAAARLHAGWAATKGQDFYLQRDSVTLEPYLHHPPLYGNLMALAYWATGNSGEFITRLIPALFHLAGFVGLGFLARKLFGGDRAKLAVSLALYAVLPMSAYFGKMPFNESVGLCWTVWALYLLQRFREQPEPGRFLGSLFFWILSALTSWTAYFLILAYGALLAWEGRRGLIGCPNVERSDCTWTNSARPGVVLVAASVLVGVLIWVHIYWAADWKHLTVFASAGKHVGVEHYGPAALLKRAGKVIDFHRMYFANIPAAMFIVWFLIRFPRLFRRSPDSLPFRDRFLLAGSAAAAAWTLFILKAASIHAYAQFWFLPFLSLAVGGWAVDLWNRAAGRRKWRTAVALFAAIATLASSAATLHYRYTHPGGYAVSASACFAEQYRMGR